MQNMVKHYGHSTEFGYYSMYVLGHIMWLGYELLSKIWINTMNNSCTGFGSVLGVTEQDLAMCHSSESLSMAQIPHLEPRNLPHNDANICTVDMKPALTSACTIHALNPFQIQNF
jgi:hypothetical protein